MSVEVFLLVITSAIFHASWNFALRKLSGNIVVAWLAFWAGGILLLPVSAIIVLQNGLSESLPAFSLLMAILSGIIHWWYLTFLALAYRYGDISIVYPIARGTGVGLTAILAWIILQEDISFAGFTGIGMILIGIFLTGGKIAAKQQDRLAVKYALLTGLTIGMYSLTDKVGVSGMHPVIFLCIVFIVSAAFMSPYILRKYASEIIPMFKTNFKYILMIGPGSMITYLLILFAFRLGAVSYIVAMREFAIVVGVFLGIVFLKETVTWKKWAGVLIITLGLIFLKIG